MASAPSRNSGTKRSTHGINSLGRCGGCCGCAVNLPVYLSPAVLAGKARPGRSWLSMEQRSELLTALLATAWRGLGRSLAATVGGRRRRVPSARSASCECADGRWRKLRLAYRPTRRMDFLADAAGFRELQPVQNGQGLTPEIARFLRAASRFTVIAKVIKNRSLCTSAPDVTR